MQEYGHFDDSAREFVITTPKTPFPWINYLGTEAFFSLMSQTGGGYSFYRDARLRRITRYRYNNVPVDAGGRCFYLNDNGEVWNPGWAPCKTELDSYECRHGLGYTRINSSRNGVTADLLTMVPLGKDCEVQQLTLTNTSKETKSLKLFSLTEFCLWNAMDDSSNFQRNWSIGEVEVIGSAIYHKTEYRERRNHFAFYSVNQPVAGFDTDRNAFLGPYNGFHDAQVPFIGESRQSVAHGWAPVASHALHLTLKPGESKTYVFVLGYIENDPAEKWEAPHIINKARATALQAEFDTPEKVDQAMAALRDSWESLLGKYVLECADDKLLRSVNIWNPYQVMITFNMSRSASYFESGIGRGMGFRDSNQDLLGFVHMVPERARERLLDLAATQLEDGGAYHQYQPLTKRGNAEMGGNFNDDPLWMIASTAAYIKETGDMAILEEVVPFENDDDKAASMFEHLKRSFYHVINNRGPHGLPLIGRADWNDCLNLNCFSTEPGDSFQTCGNKDGRNAESVLIAGMFCFIGRDYVELCRVNGLTEEAEKAEAHIAEMEACVKEHGWDGGWYLRAYDDAGRKVGGESCDEGQIFIESQGFCAMAEIGKDEGMPGKALDAVAERLETEHGIVLQQPAYQTYHLNLGEISSYPPGYKENAGIFCHNNPWVMIAEAIYGRGDRAFELFTKVSPAWIKDQTLHTTEPYVYSQMIAGTDAPTHGEAKNSWLTGTAAWMYVAISQWILGVRSHYNGLIIDPSIPASMDRFTVKREFRGAHYEIRISNPDRVCKGITSLKLNGQTIDGQCIPVQPAGTRNIIEAVMG